MVVVFLDAVLVEASYLKELLAVGTFTRPVLAVDAFQRFDDVTIKCAVSTVDDADIFDAGRSES